MAIEKQMTPLELPEDEMDENILEVEVSDLDEVEEDGSVVVDFGGLDDLDMSRPTHNDNLVDFMEDIDRDTLAGDLIESFTSDRQSRSEWAESYVRGMDLLGLKIEERTEPWPGASGVFHPLLIEAVVRFQAQAMGEIFPAQGPARFKTMGKRTPELVQQGHRVETELNFQLTEKMTEFRDEMDSMLFRLPLAGSSFKKAYFDPLRKRPVSMLVPAEDLVISYGASDLATSARYTHVMKKSDNEVRKLQVNGFYRDISLNPPQIERSDIEKKYDEMEGATESFEEDDRRTLLEMHVDLDLPGDLADVDGIARPYVVTIDKSDSEILSIRRNWYEDDEDKEKRLHFTHYKYLPGMGFYGLGLIHIIGGLTKSATSILRQLIDAGTIANLPGGLKARGLRIKGDDTPIMPGEFRDVDVPGGTIKDSLAFLPHKEPSIVLYQLLGNIVEEGRRVGSVADVDIGNMSNEAPVGTTLALMERSLKVMSGVQARLHAALKLELRLLGRIIHDYMPPEYDYYFGDDEEYNRKEDFDGRVDIIPVSDPNASTMAQRIVQYQAALQLAEKSPQLYDMGKLHRQMLEVLGIQDVQDIIKLPEDIKPKDPVAENMAILNQSPVKAFEYQDHEAHLQGHMAAAQDPKIMQIVGQSPFASAIQAAAAAHITEHVAFKYRMDIQRHLGATMPDVGEELPPDMERQVSRLAAAASDKMLRQSMSEDAQRQAQEVEKDPLTQIQRAELAIKDGELKLDQAKAQHDALMDIEELLLKDKEGTARGRLMEQSSLAKAEVDKLRVSSNERIRGADIGLRAGAELLKKGGPQGGTARGTTTPRTGEDG